MKTTLVLALFLCLAGSLLADQLWEDFKAKYGKVYEDEMEEKLRYSIFSYNLHTIEAHNKRDSTFKMGINQFADMPNGEYQAKMTNRRLKTKRNAKSAIRSKMPKALPDTVDWRTSGCTRAVEDQGQLGCVWSIVSIETIESQNCLAHDITLARLSEQNLLDCVAAPFGCNALVPDDAFEYVVENGIDTEESYPYEGTIGDCRFNPDTVGASSSGYVDVPYGDEATLQEAAAAGTVAAGIDASMVSFQLYISGVYSDPSCNPDEIDHLIFIVGYGTEDGADYWLCQNSWGSSWGENGFIKIARNQNNMCGIASLASYPVMI